MNKKRTLIAVVTTGLMVELALASQAPALPGLTLAELVAPASVQIPSQGGYGRGAQASTGLHYRLRTGMSAAAVGDHYVAQLVSRGWRLTLKQANADFAMARFSAGSTIDPQTGVLTVVPVNETGEVLVEARVVRSLAPWRTTLIRSGGGGASEAAGMALDSPTIRKALERLLQGPAAARGERSVQQEGVPRDFPKELLPPQAQPGPSAVSPSTSTVVGTVRNVTAKNLTVFLRQLHKAGWWERVMSGGFRPDANVGIDACQNGLDASIGLTMRPDQSALFRSILDSRPNAPCPSPGVNVADMLMPVLIPPASVSAERRNMSRGSDYALSEMRMQTLMTPAALMSHFEAQLTAAGWKVDARAGDPVQAVVRLSALPAAGTPAIGVLMLTLMPGAKEVDAFFSILATAQR